MPDRNVVPFAQGAGDTDQRTGHQANRFSGAGDSTVGRPLHGTILRTKLHRPPLSADLVTRERLLELMAGVVAVPLTVVSAPAGYGKSVLVSQWAEHNEHPVAWLTLDDSDADLHSFLRYVVAALDTVRPDLCPRTAQLARAQEIPPVQAVAAELINELDAAGSPVFLVFDDYYRIAHTSEVHELVRRVLEFPPAQLHVVIITRCDPPMALPSLRANNRLIEIRRRDLRFTAPEIAGFLAGSTGLAITDDTLAILEKQVEGWAVGLRLTALALRHVDDPEAFLQQLGGSLQTTQDYLLHEILDQRTPRMRRWLLQTSILDRFCPELCDAVGGDGVSPDGAGFDGRQFVTEVQGGNLFVVPLDIQGNWLRYHHLFQELLKKELRQTARPGEIAELHARAGMWFESQGLIDEALDHALAAEDMDRAAQIVERNRLEALNNDQWYLIEKWLARLPIVTVNQRAELLVAQAWVFLRRLRFENMLGVLDQVEDLLDDDPGQQSLKGELALFRGFVSYFMGDGARSMVLLEEALARMPATYHEPRCEAETMFALANQMEGRQKQAIRRLDEQMSLIQTGHDLSRSRMLAVYVFLQTISGDLIEAAISNRRFREAAAHGRHGHVEAWGAYLQGLIHLYRNELDLAAEPLTRSAGQRFIHHKRAAVDSLAGLMVMYQLRGQADEAGAALHDLREYVAALGDPAYTTLAESAAARLAILQGRPEATVRWLATTVAPIAEVMLFWFEVPCLTWCRALIAEGTPSSLAEAEERLRELEHMNEAQHNICHLIEILSLLTTAVEKQGRPEDALTTLERTVRLAQPGGFALPFLELGQPLAALLGRLATDLKKSTFVQDLLAAFEGVHDPSTSPPETGTAPPPNQPPGNLGSLTNRELDVLDLLQQRLQNKEIAARLCISDHTVADHLKRIYRKLGVCSRRQAVERAKATGTLGKDN